uniref:flagellin n=1 Tax=Shewanella sp. TaxID=50422 RepID=UPI004047951B
AAVTIQPPGYTQQLGAISEKTINLADSTAVADSMKKFILNVNGGGEIALDMSAALDNAAVEDAAVTKSQFVTAMQKTIDDSGFFTGANKVTVSVGTDGLVQLAVAGGVGSIVVKEGTAADGLIAELTGDNGGAAGAAIDSVTSGGVLKLGQAYNDAAGTTTALAAPGTMTLTVVAGDQAVAGIILTDDQGKKVTLTTSTIVAATATGASLANAFNSVLTGVAVGGEGTGTRTLATGTSVADANLYSFSSSATNKLTITRADGRDFTIQRTAGANTATLTPDTTSATALVIGGSKVTSAQKVETFGIPTTTMGSNYSAVKEVFSQVFTTAAAGATMTFDGLVYTQQSATNKDEINGFVAAYNNRSASNFIAENVSDTTLKFTAKVGGARPDAELVVVSGGGAIAGRTGVTQGVDATYNVENVLRLKVGSSGTATDVVVSATDFQYSSMEALATKVQSAIDASSAFQGNNAVTVSVLTDTTGKQGLGFTQATGQAMEINGSFITGELGETSYTAAAPLSVAATPSSTGGINLSGSNNVVSLSLVDADSGKTINRSVTLASSGTAVAAADYAVLLASALNSDLAADGYSVTAGVSNGQFSLSLDQAGGKTINLSGASVTAAFGGAVTATGAAAVTAQASGSGVVVDNGVATAGLLSAVKVDTVANANAAIASIDNSIEYVNSQRASLGAIQNRLDHTVSNLTNIATNTEASRSRIMDADYGQESAALAKAQIIQQAATAMLAQANQSSQSVLSLLQ